MLATHISLLSLLLMAIKIAGYKRINLASQWVSHVVLMTDTSLAGTC